MRDIDRLLSEALQRQGEDYEPSDPHGARAAFVERLRRRRRLLYLRTGGAVAAVALIAAVVLMPGSLTEPGPDVELASVTPEVVATIPVGGAPSSSSAASDGAVWVATGDDVVAIDPEANGVVMNARTAGRSDEVAAGDDHVWVATTEGDISMVSPQSGSVVARASVPFPQPLDIAASGDSLWAVGLSNGDLYEIGPFPGGSGPEPADDAASIPDVEEGEDGLLVMSRELLGQPLTDVAVGDAGLWVLFREGESAGVFLVDPEDITGGGTPIPVEVGNSPDLAVGLHAVWLATGDKGTVERIDPRTGEVTASVEVGGRYTDLAVGEGVVWAVTGGDGPSRLYQIGADGEFIGEPLELEGDPVDVAVGAGAVWVADQEEGDVLRIEPQPRAEEPTPEATPTPTPDAQAEDPVLFVYATGGEFGDLYAKRTAGEVERLSMTPDFEMNPAIAPDGTSVVFERDDYETDNPIVLIHHDLETGEEQILAEGSHPAFATDGRMAFLRPLEDPSSGSVGVAIGEVVASDRRGRDVEFEETMSFVIDGAERDGLRNLHWEHDGETLYFEMHREGWVTTQVNLDAVSDGERVEPFVLHPDEPQLGLESVVSTGAVVTGVDALSICCREGTDALPEGATVGRIHFTEGGAEYADLAVQVPSGFKDGSGVQVFAALRGWRAFPDGSWVCCGPQGWLLGDGTSLWWVNEGRQEPVLIENAAGVESVGVNPSIERIHPVSLGGS